MEPLLTPEVLRYSAFPIRHPDIWEWYKKAFCAIWSPGEVDMSKDVTDWKGLTESEQHFLCHVLAFFAQSDGIVCDNLAERFCKEVQYREAKFFYDLQKMMENVHNEVYSSMIDTLISDPNEKDRLFRAIETIPCVQKKAEWAKKWIDSDTNFASRLIAFAVVEGIFFSGSFCAIFYMKKRGLLPGLCANNTLIARDEGMHQEFAAHLYKHHIVNKLPEATVHEIVTEAVEYETEFICSALPVSLIGMDNAQMTSYIKFVADRLLQQLGVSTLYGEPNPFPWMQLLGLENKTNFFESRVTEYQKANVRSSSESHTFGTDADF